MRKRQKKRLLPRQEAETKHHYDNDPTPDRILISASFARTLAHKGEGTASSPLPRQEAESNRMLTNDSAIALPL
jgi:hypothetical protein